MIQRSFSSGEVDPALYGRADVDRWKAALKLCKNWVVQPEGGIVVRQGFEYLGSVTGSGDPDDIRLVPFEFGPYDSHVLLFNDNYGACNMYIMDNGAFVYGEPVRDVIIDRTVTPWQITSVWGGNLSYGTGDIVTVYSGKNKGSTYTITSTIYPGIEQLAGTVATSGTERAFLQRTTIFSGGGPYICKVFFPTSSMDGMNYVQSGDTIFSAAPNGGPKKITRELFSGVDRTLSFVWDYVPGTPPQPVVTTLSIAGTAGTSPVRYRITSTDGDGLESAIFRKSAVMSGAITGTTTLSVTSTGHGLITSDTILFDTALSDSAGNLIHDIGALVRVVYVDANTFTIPGSTSGNTATGPFNYIKIEASALLTQPASGTPITVSWSSVPGAVQYNVFREFGRVFGYIGSTAAATFIDNGIIPDQKDTPITGISPFYKSYLYGTADAPRAVGIFQQRLIWGGFDEDIERITCSHVGNYTAYDPGAEDASGIDFTTAGRTVSGVHHLLEIAGRAVVLTDTSEWVLRGGTNGGLTPTAINARADSYYGSSDVMPSLIGTSLIYVQRGDRIVREAKYDFSQEALSSSDLTLWAKHLFVPEVKRLAYQRTAQILWVLRKDGKLMGMTYIPEQNIWGWHQHNIEGHDIHDICVVAENGIDRLYCASISGTDIRMLRLPLAWESGDVDDHIGFDMSLKFDGTLSGTGTLTGGTNWTTDETLTLTASTSNFVVGDVGKVFLLRLGDDSVYVTCTAYASGTGVSVTPNTIVPVALQGVASESIARCAQTFSGLTHLEGATVGVIADGSREPNEVVTGGAITLDGWFARVQAGLVITADAQTLDVEPDEKDTYLGDYKHVTRVYLRVKDTRGLTVGLDATHLEPFMPQYAEDMLVNANPALQSGPVEVLMDSTHEELGSILMRQDTGLPATILNARPVFNAGELK